MPVSSVSLIPPPPPPKNVARLLALALAESAQQASTQSLKRPGACQSAPVSYGDAAVAAAEEQLPVYHPHGTLDQACVPADGPAEHFLLPNHASGSGHQLLPDPAAAGHQAHASAPEPGQQPRQADFPPHRACAPGDPDQARTTTGPLTDSQSDEHISFREDQPGKSTGPTVSFADQDQTQVHFYSGDQPPSYLGASVDQPHQPSQLTDKSPTPSRDKPCPPPGSPEEPVSTAGLAYVAAAAAAADTGAWEACWDPTEQPTAADFASATLQRPHRTHRPLPAPPSQRPAEPSPAVGQVPATACAGLNNSHKVRRGRVKGRKCTLQRSVPFQQGVWSWSQTRCLFSRPGAGFHEAFPLGGWDLPFPRCWFFSGRSSYTTTVASPSLPTAASCQPPGSSFRAIPEVIVSQTGLWVSGLPWFSRPGTDSS